MNRIDYLGNHDVQDFCKWLADQAVELPIQLVFRPSQRIPNPDEVNGNVEGLTDALTRYRWKSTWYNGEDAVCANDWGSTRNSLARLGEFIQHSVGHGTDAEALEACRQILAWGGDRNGARGAMPFLQEKVHPIDHPKGLRSYLSSCRDALTLDTANLDNVNAVEKMNSMLTKVHALLSPDGLPIYDSRVAGAISCLVELWASRTNVASPCTLLEFPWLIEARSPRVLARNPRFDRRLTYQPQDTSVWISAKVRLGWILRKVLDENNDLFNTEEGGERARLHAAEASLFVIGYDPRCLLADAAATGAHEVPQAHCGGGAEPAVDTGWIRDQTLARGSKFSYMRTDDGVRVRMGPQETELTLSHADLDVITQSFVGTRVTVGASRTNPPPDSLGAWLADEGALVLRRDLSGRTSYIAALLVAEAYARSVDNGAELDFQECATSGSPSTRK